MHNNVKHILVLMTNQFVYVQERLFGYAVLYDEKDTETITIIYIKAMKEK